MYRALITGVLAACTACASFALPNTAEPGALGAPDTAVRVKLQPGAEGVKVSTKHGEAQTHSVAQRAANDTSSTDDSGWRTYGTLLATLVLMGVIAVRRQRSGRP